MNVTSFARALFSKPLYKGLLRWNKTSRWDRYHFCPPCLYDLVKFSGNMLNVEGEGYYFFVKREYKKFLDRQSIFFFFFYFVPLLLLRVFWLLHKAFFKTTTILYWFCKSVCFVVVPTLEGKNYFRLEILEFRNKK